MMSKFVSANTASSSGSGTLPGNTISNPKEKLKGITTRSGIAYQGPKTPSPSKQGTKVTKDQVQTPSSQNTTPIQLSVIQYESQASVSEPVVAPVSAPMPNLKPSIPYPSRRDKEKCHRSVSKPIGIAKDVSFKVRVFHFPVDFVIVDFEPDPRVPLIIGRCFLKTSRALIDVHKGELTLRIGNEAITYNLDQTVRYSTNYNQMTANKIDVIESACEEYSQEVLGFSNVTASGTPTPHNDPIVSATSPTLTPFGDSDFLLFEEADAFLSLEDDPDSPKINPFYYDPKGDILLLEAILNSEPSPPLHNQEQNLPSYFQIPIDPRDQEKTTFTAHMARLPTVACLSACAMLRALFKDKMLQRCEDTNLSLNWEKSHFMVKEGIVLGHKISKNGIEVDKAKIDVIAKLPHPTTVKGVRSFLTPILIAPNWDLPFELMCDTSDFAIGAVLGQRHEKHFRPIHYASKTMNDAETNYTTTEKEMLAVVYAFEKFWSYLIMNKSIVHTDHSILKYLFAKKDAKARLLRWVLLLQEFDFKVLDTKEAENLAVDHLSRLENPYENVLDPKDINETFPLETLSMVIFRGDSSAPWFVDFANYHAGNFIVKGKLKTHWSGPFTITKVFHYGTIELSQAKRPNFKVNGHRVKHYFGGDVPQLDYPDCEVSRALSFSFTRASHPQLHFGRCLVLVWGVSSI
nr:reverse transcriptase domain-containing protein [Tanacetum cinerariifolium]